MFPITVFLGIKKTTEYLVLLGFLLVRSMYSLLSRKNLGVQFLAQLVIFSVFLSLVAKYRVASAYLVIYLSSNGG